MKMKKFLIGLSVFSLVFYPLDTQVTVLLALGAILLSAFVLKDKETTAKTLQPALLIAPVYVLRSVIGIVFSIINNFARNAENYYTSGFYEFYSAFSNVMSAVYLILAVLAIVVLLVCFLKNKDVPVVGNWANKLTECKAAQKPEKEETSAEKKEAEEPEKSEEEKE